MNGIGVINATGHPIALGWPDELVVPETTTLEEAVEATAAAAGYPRPDMTTTCSRSSRSPCGERWRVRHDLLC